MAQTKLSQDLLRTDVEYNAHAFVPSGSAVPTNGLFLPALNVVALATASTERLRLLEDGRLLIGKTTTTTPEIFQVAGSMFTSGYIYHYKPTDGLVRDIVSGTRHTREYNDVSDGRAGVTIGTVSEYSLTFNAKFIPAGNDILTANIDTTALSTTATTADTSLLKIGDEITSVNVPGGTYIATIVNATTFTMNSAALNTGTSSASFKRYWVRDRAHPTDHSYLRRMNESYEEEVWYSECAAEGDGVIWQLRSRIQMITGENHMYGSLTLTSGPVNDYDVATKIYVDSTSQGLVIHQEVVCSTVANITLSGLQLIDGYQLVGGERVLVQFQTDSTQNGVYIASTGAWTRSSDTNAAGLQATSAANNMIGAYVFVTNGTTLVNSSWVMSVKPYTLGTTDIVWTKFFAAGNITASTGLEKVGNDIRAKLAAGHLQLNASNQIRLATNALATLGGAPLANPNFSGVVYGKSDSQTGFYNASFQSYSAAGDTGFSFHCAGATAIWLRHVRGTNLLRVLDANNNLARIETLTDAWDGYCAWNFGANGYWAAVPMRTRHVSGTGISSPADGTANVTINHSGYYQINAQALVHWAGAWNNGGHLGIGINGGLVVPGSAGYGVYNYYSSPSVSAILYVSAGSTVQLFFNGITSAYILAGWCELNIHRLV